MTEASTSGGRNRDDRNEVRPRKLTGKSPSECAQAHFVLVAAVSTARLAIVALLPRALR